MGSCLLQRGSESQLKASTWSDFMEVSQLAVFPFLEFDNSSCKVMGKSLSIDMSPCTSIDECHLFGGGDHLDSGLREIVESGCPSA